MSDLQYSILDNSFSENSRKLQTLGSGTFGQVSLCSTLHGDYVSKETKIDDKSIGYPPDFLTEIDVLLKFRKLPSIIKIQGLNFEMEQRKARILLEVMSCNLSDWCKNNSFSDRVKVLPQLIKEIGGSLAVIHFFQFVHNDIKTNNILVDTTSGVPKFKIADFGKSLRVRDEEKTIYGGIEKYKPPTHRNIYESEYWAFMIVLSEVILGSRLVTTTTVGNDERNTEFYRKNSDTKGFQLRRLLETKLKPNQAAEIPEEFWKFVEPILYENKPRMAISLKRIFGPRSYKSPPTHQCRYLFPETEEVKIEHFDSFISREILEDIADDISKDVGKQKQYEMMKHEFKQYFADRNLTEYYSRFSRLFNKFLSKLNSELDRESLKRYAEVAVVIVLKSKITRYTNFSSERDFLLAQRAFLNKICYQTIII